MAPFFLIASAACSATAADDVASSSESNLDESPPAAGPLTPDPGFAGGAALTLPGTSRAVAAARRSDGALAVLRDRVNGDATDVVLSIVAADGSTTSDVVLPDATSLRYAQVLTHNDGVVVVGQVPISEHEVRYYARRVGADGAIDPTFTPDPLDFTVVDTTVDKSGRILVSGNTQQHAAIVRLNPNGMLDPTFAAQGAWITSDDRNTVSKLALGADGAISVVTQSPTKTTLTRFDANGALDSSFGTKGIVELPIDSGQTDRTALIATARGGLTYIGPNADKVPTLHSFAIDAHGALTPGDAVDGAIVDISTSGLISAVTHDAVCTLHISATATTELTADECASGVRYLSLGKGRRALVVTSPAEGGGQSVSVRVFAR